MAEKEFQEQIIERLERMEKLIAESAKEVLTMKECVEYTGYSQNHLHRLTSQNLIPFYKPMGGRIYFKKSEINDWLLSNREATDAEIAKKAASYCATH